MGRPKKVAQNITLKDNPLICPICGNQLFYTRRILLNTVTASLFDLDWANRRANCYI